MVTNQAQQDHTLNNKHNGQFNNNYRLNYLMLNRVVLLSNYVGWEYSYVKLNLSLGLLCSQEKILMVLFRLFPLSIALMEINSYVIMTVKKSHYHRIHSSWTLGLLLWSWEFIQEGGKDSLSTRLPSNIDINLLYLLYSFYHYYAIFSKYWSYQNIYSMNIKYMLIK